MAYYSLKNPSYSKLLKYQCLQKFFLVFFKVTPNSFKYNGNTDLKLIYNVL